MLNVLIVFLKLYDQRNQFTLADFAAKPPACISLVTDDCVIWDLSFRLVENLTGFGVHVITEKAVWNSQRIFQTAF